MLRMVLGACLAAATVAVLLLLAGGDATGTQLLLNPGFEEGTDGWIVPDETVLTISDEALSGDAAGEMSGPSDGSRILQYAAIQPGAQYRYSGWVFADDPLMIYAWLQIAWYDGGTFLGTVDSSFLVGPHPAYAFLELEAIAPPNANSAQLLVRAKSGAASSMLLDDLAFELEEAPVTTAPVASTASATTPAVTATTPATPATPTRSPEPTASRTPTPSPVRPSATPSEPKVFSSLVNGGFEEVREDGTPYGWRKIGGAIAVTGSPIAAGSRALEVKSETSSTKWAYQTVSIGGGRYYVASAMAWNNDPDAEAVFLRVSWYTSEDGSGEAIGNEDSIDALGPGSGNWRSLATEPMEAPVMARSARVRLMLRPAGEVEAIVYFDSVKLTEAPAPTDAPATATPALPTVTPTPTATAPATATPDATQTVTATPMMTASPPPTASPTASPSPSPMPTVVEPRVFSELVNGGFEVSREDGTPYGWWKVGGEMAVSDSAAMVGELGLEVVSRTDVTKWVYQTVSVEPGAWYEAAAWAMNEPGVEAALVRVSWYASETGEGSALASEDSGELQSADGAFHFLSTEAIRAPEGAHSAKVRLLVRPASSGAAMSCFDSVSFSRVEEPELETEASTRTPAPTRAASSGGGGSTVVFGATEGGEPPETAAERSVAGLANVHPAPVVLAAAEEPGTDDDDVSVGDAFAGALVGFSLVAIGGIFGQDLWAQSRKKE